VSARLEREDVLRQVWGRLDDTQRAAVAEVVHGPSAYLLLDQFRAKYGRTPEFGALDYSYYGRSGARTARRLFFFGGLKMPDDLRARLGRSFRTRGLSRTLRWTSWPTARSRSQSEQPSIRRFGSFSWCSGWSKRGS
jgi:hypothetical protein